MNSIFDAALVGGLAGLVCGIAPLIVALKRQREVLGLMSLVLCGIAGMLLGVILAVPIALVLCAVAWASSNGPRP